MGFSQEDARTQRLIIHYIREQEYYIAALQSGRPFRTEWGFINRMAEYLMSPRRRAYYE